MFKDAALRICLFSAMYLISSSFSFDFRCKAPPTEVEAETVNIAKIVTYVHIVA